VAVVVQVEMLWLVRAVLAAVVQVQLAAVLTLRLAQ
jgi:hypothetical protein